MLVGAIEIPVGAIFGIIVVTLMVCSFINTFKRVFDNETPPHIEAMFKECRQQEREYKQYLREQRKAQRLARKGE